VYNININILPEGSYVFQN